MEIIGTICVVLSCLLSLQVCSCNASAFSPIINALSQHLLSHLRNIASIEQINICR